GGKGGERGAAAPRRTPSPSERITTGARLEASKHAQDWRLRGRRGGALLKPPRPHGPLDEPFRRVSGIYLRGWQPQPETNFRCAGTSKSLASATAKRPRATASKRSSGKRRFRKPASCAATPVRCRNFRSRCSTTAIARSIRRCDC